MSYLGNTPTDQSFVATVDYFNGDGSTVAFTLSRQVASIAQVQAVIENVPQNPSQAFSVLGNVITFTSAPPSGSANIYVYYTSPNTKVMAPSAGTVDTVALAAAAVTSTKMANSGYEFGMRNRIINGDMKIDQRNAGALVAGTTGNIYGVDRFATGVFGSATGRISAQQSSLVPDGTGFTKSIANTVTTADSAPSSIYGYCFQQKIEGHNVADLAWGTSAAQTVTLSFWVRSSIAGTYIVTFSNSDASDNPNRTYSATYTINSANTWEQKVITVAGDTTGTWLKDNRIGLFLIWGLGGGTARQAPSVNSWNTGASGGIYAVTDAAGCVDWIATSGATFNITGVQLEKGPVATPFEYRPYGTELGLCQRYFEKSYRQQDKVGTTTPTGYQVFTTGTNSLPQSFGFGQIFFKVTKRASAPTCAVYSYTSATVGVLSNGSNGVDLTAGSATLNAVNDIGFNIYNNSGGTLTTASYSVIYMWTADAEL